MALRFESVRYRYGQHLWTRSERSALDGISLHVRAGDCYGFIGHNGAGKTTAMRLALGLLRMQAGRVLVDGFDAARHPNEARARMGGLVETPGFYPALSGEANLVLLARAAGMKRGEARREAQRVLERVGLAADGARAAGGYSQGMRQRLGIAQALLGKPRIVLLDEPTNGLDPEGIAEMRKVFASLARDEGVSVLLSSHQLHELEGLCNRVAVLRQGRVVVEAETAELLRRAATRYRLRTGDVAAARARLLELGLAPERSLGAAADELDVDLGGRPPGEVARALVEGGVDLAGFAARTPSLEEIVLARGPADASAAEGARAETSAATRAGVPAERLAPPGALGRAARYESTRLFARPAAPLLFVLPALAGLIAELARARELALERRAVEAGELFGTTAVTAFEGVGVALQAGLPLLALVAAGLASQAIAGDFARGTLKNLLLRPIGRARVALGKAAAQMVGAVLGYALLVVAALAGAALLFDFGDVEEVLPSGLVYTHLEAQLLWPELWSVLPSGLAPALAASALGLFAGALVRSPAGALALGLGGLVAIDLARALARPFGFEGLLLTAQLPSPLGDRSAVAGYVDFCRGVSNPLEPASQSPALVALCWLVPALLFSAWILSRRSIP